MLKKMFKGLSFVAVIAMATACATGPQLAPMGTYDVGSYSIPLQQDWTAFNIKTGKGKKAYLLTVDGPALNAVYVFSDLVEGDSLLKQRKKEEPVPTYSADLSDLELVEFLTNSLDKGSDFARIEAINIAPRSFAGADGIAFDIKGMSESGLNMSGTALMANMDSGLSIVLFVAPSEHYYGKLKDEVEGIFSDLALASNAS